MKSILKIAQKMLTNNGVLKISALVIAAIIWLSVVNVNDPTKTVIISRIPIDIVNEEAITENNQVYTVESKTYVDVTVSGRRSVVDNLSVSSFKAEASMEELSVTNSIPVVVSLKNKSLENKVTLWKQSVSQLNVSIENIITKTYTIETDIVGKVAKNYELGKTKISKETVDVTAPESVHDRIERVAVNVDIDGATDDVSDRYRIQLLDENGENIETENTILSNKKVKVSVQLLKIVTVPIVVETKGNPQSGYEITNISTDPEKVTLAGPVSVINGIKEIKIDGDVADVSGITASVETTVDLIDYLVQNVVIRGESEVKLNIDVEGDISKKFTINPDDIVLENVPEGYKAQVVSNSIKISLYGRERAFDGVDEDSFNPSVSLEGLEAGKSTVDLNITVPNGLTLEEKVKIKVKLTKE